MPVPTIMYRGVYARDLPSPKRKPRHCHIFCRSGFGVPVKFKKFRPAVVDVLSDPQFRVLITSQAIFDLGIFIRAAAVFWVVLELTHSSLWIGVVGGVRVVPVLLLAMFGGVISDRFGRRNLMIASGAIMAGVSAITAILITSGTLVMWHMIALSILGGIAGALYGPAFYALVADIVRSDRLSNANGIVSVAQETGEMLGPVIAGLVIAASGTDTVFWLVVAGNSFGLMLMFRVREPERSETDKLKSKGALTGQLMAGLRFARNTPVLLWLTTLVTAQNIFGFAIFPLMPVYADEVLKIGPGGYGLMGGALGAGTLTGAVLVSIFGIHRRRSYVLVGTVIVWDAGMILFGVSRSVPLSMVILFLMGLVLIAYTTAILTMFQEAASTEMRARVMSLYVIAMNMFPLGLLFGGAMAEWIGNEEALAISALLGVSISVLALVLSKELRRA